MDPFVKISYISTPNDHTSDLEVNSISVVAISGAVHRTGNWVARKRKDSRYRNLKYRIYQHDLFVRFWALNRHHEFVSYQLIVESHAKYIKERNIILTGNLTYKYGLNSLCLSHLSPSDLWRSRVILIVVWGYWAASKLHLTNRLKRLSNQLNQVVVHTVDCKRERFCSRMHYPEFRGLVPVLSVGNKLGCTFSALYLSSDWILSSHPHDTWLDACYCAIGPCLLLSGWAPLHSTTLSEKVHFLYPTS